MTKVPGNLKYTKDHEWISVSDGVGVVGITDFAQNAMGDVVYVELPEVGQTVAADEDFIVVESVKGAHDVFSPVSGTVIEVNEELDESPELLNEDAYANWLVKMELSDESELDDLLTAAAYTKLVEELEAENE